MRRLSNPRLRARQAWRKADIGPNRTEKLVLEAIERTGGLLVRFQGGKFLTSLADGTPVSRLGEFDLGMAVEAGWLRPDPLSPGLLHGAPAQRYFATGLTSIRGGRR